MKMIDKVGNKISSVDGIASETSLSTFRFSDLECS